MKMYKRTDKKAPASVTKHEFIMFDWKSYPEAPDVTKALSLVFDGKQCPSIVEVPDTGGDWGCWVISSEPITEALAQELMNTCIAEKEGMNEE
jgi:hypothetical protein